MHLKLQRSRGGLAGAALPGFQAPWQPLWGSGVSYTDICLGAPAALRQWGRHFERARICLSVCELQCETSRRAPLASSYLEHHSKAGRTLVIMSRGPDSALTPSPTGCGAQGPFFLQRTWSRSLHCGVWSDTLPSWLVGLWGSEGPRDSGRYRAVRGGEGHYRLSSQSYLGKGRDFLAVWRPQRPR